MRKLKKRLKIEREVWRSWRTLILFKLKEKQNEVRSRNGCNYGLKNFRILKNCQIALKIQFQHQWSHFEIRQESYRCWLRWCSSLGFLCYKMSPFQLTPANLITAILNLTYSASKFQSGISEVPKCGMKL